MPTQKITVQQLFDELQREIQIPNRIAKDPAVALREIEIGFTNLMNLMTEAEKDTILGIRDKYTDLLSFIKLGHTEVQLKDEAVQKQIRQHLSNYLIAKKQYIQLLEAQQPEKPKINPWIIGGAIAAIGGAILIAMARRKR